CCWRWLCLGWVGFRISSFGLPVFGVVFLFVVLCLFGVFCVGVVFVGFWFYVYNGKNGGVVVRWIHLDLMW
ncbi:hypothetical protein, partial [Klebsiella pneumoniae]|uniref:hypothetical protein n=1 Tax=Klebsiella pneumoniae TaxID=573 RepID=UPI0039C30DCF